MDAANPETRYRLALNAVSGVGPVRQRQLLQRFGSASAIFSQSPASLQQAGLEAQLASAILDADRDSVVADLDWLEDPRHHLLGIDEDSYPPLLAAISDAPPLLYVAGDAGLLLEPQLAIVGSRRPTPAGARVAQDFAQSLARAGVLITSGLALGVDAAAHRGALTAGQPTIAVAATGLDRVYPARHQDLAADILDNGALVSEFPIGTEPRPEHFPRRNRILTGLALGTLVVEAALKSGSLTSARHAMEQGREVFAIPGSIRNPLARGCHALIRDGAWLVEQVDDILLQLAPHLRDALLQPEDGTSAHSSQADAEADPGYGALTEAVGFDPVGVDELVERTGLTPPELSSMLLILEMNGTIESLEGGLFVRTG